MRLTADFAPALAVAGLIFALSSRPLAVPEQLPSWSDLLAHAVLFGLLAGALWRGWRRRGWAAAAAGPIVVTAVYGVLDEVHQAFVPGRSPDPADVAADLVGALLAVTAARLLRPGPGAASAAGDQALHAEPGDPAQDEA